MSRLRHRVDSGKIVVYAPHPWRFPPSAVQQDITSWPATVKWAQDEIDRLRGRLEADLDPAQTASLRGEIRALKRLVARPQDAARQAAMTTSRPLAGSY